MKTLSFVIPVYNEEKRLEKTFKALRELRLPSGLQLEKIVFINDGSTDGTELQITSYKLQVTKKAKTQIKIISYSQNMGKGYAVRQGMLATTSDYTLLFDADISTPLSELKKFAPLIKNNIDVIIGTRKNGKSTVVKHQPLVRESMGHAFTLIAKLILQINVTDFTCGFKAFSAPAKAYIFSQSVINGWTYDGEAIFLAKKGRFSIAEKSVVWSNETGSKVTLFKAVPQTFYELFLIRKNSLMRAYNAPMLVQPSLSQ